MLCTVDITVGTRTVAHDSSRRLLKLVDSLGAKDFSDVFTITIITTITITITDTIISVGVIIMNTMIIVIIIMIIISSSLPSSTWMLP